MGVREVKPIFNQNAHLIGRRDCMVMPVSALNGYVTFFYLKFVLLQLNKLYHNYLYLYDFISYI